MANNSENEKLSAKVRRALDDLAEIRQSLLSMAEPGVEGNEKLCFDRTFDLLAIKQLLDEH